jgi:tetratricopeptide (TPR) repeat protein
VRDKVDNLERAIQAYQEALKIRTLESYPIDYARTQNNLGGAYWSLAQVLDKRDNLDKAIQAYQEALRIFTLDRYPLDYSIMMRDLAEARNATGISES